jgi:hypothetical protein
VDPQTDQHPPEIITPHQPTLETPDGLHPNQYAARLLEQINFPIVPSNIRAVAAAIECESKVMGLVVAYKSLMKLPHQTDQHPAEIIPPRNPQPDSGTSPVTVPDGFSHLMARYATA